MDCNLAQAKKAKTKKKFEKFIEKTWEFLTELEEELRVIT